MRRTTINVGHGCCVALFGLRSDEQEGGAKDKQGLCCLVHHLNSLSCQSHPLLFAPLLRPDGLTMSSLCAINGSESKLYHRWVPVVFITPHRPS